MKLIRLIAIPLLLFFILPENGMAQREKGRLGPDIVLNLGSALISGNTVKIGYEIPYDGYIEFDLYNPEGERIYYTSYVRTRGSHYLAFRRTTLESGVTYTFDVWYKGKKYHGSFDNT